MILYVLKKYNSGEAIRRVGIIESFKSVIWNNQWYGQGEMQIVLPATKENIQLCEVGNFICRDKDIPNFSYMRYNNAMAIQEVIYRENDSEGATIQVNGRLLKSYILGKRVVEAPTLLSGKVDAQLRSVINTNLSSVGSARQITDFGFVSSNININIDIQVEGESLAELCERVTRDTRIGWYMYARDTGFRLGFKEGTDRTSNSETPVIFSKRFDNLLSVEFDMNFLDYHNTILVQGEAGNGFNGRIWTQTGSTEYSDLDRDEMYLDSGASWEDDSGTHTVQEYKNILTGLGKRDLNAIELYSFTAEVIPDGIFKLGEDYDLGDVVEIETEVGITATARITEIIEAVDEQGESTVLTFEEWEV